MNALFKTDDTWTGLILRVMLGVVMFAHGAQKLFGWFGGNGFSGTMGFFTNVMHLPWLIAFLVIIGESIGSVALTAGLLTRFVSGSFIVIMLGAIATVHWPQGFFMNWFGQQAGEGFEYHLLVIAISAALLVTGGGKWSVDAMIARWLARHDAESRSYRKRAESGRLTNAHDLPAGSSATRDSWTRGGGPLGTTTETVERCDRSLSGP